MMHKVGLFPQRVATPQIDMKNYFGREKETAEFLRLFQKRTASLVVCQGRRRVGKSTFVSQCAAKANHFFRFEGLPPRAGITRVDQLAAFAERLANQTHAPKLTLESWPQAFGLLASLLPKGDTKIVLLLDEISWMANGDPDFAGHLKAVWDNEFSKFPKLIVVLCGSVSSWIDENILNSTGFVGRCSREFWLQPLTLPNCNQFWGKARERITPAEKLKILSVTGGIPRYLEEINPSLTAEKNIEALCFTKGALLFNEFDQIFHDIFNKRAGTYRTIVETLVEGRRTPADISRALKRGRGGDLTNALHDLSRAGFIHPDTAFNPETGKDDGGIGYRLSDNYLRFYLKYVAPVRGQVEKGLYQWAPLETLRAWDTIMGLQFENLIHQNLDVVLRKIGLENIPVLNAGPYAQTQTQRRKPCQIDLLIRSKQAIYVFETKFRRTIRKTVVEEVKEKVARMKLPHSLSIRTGLIYEGELEDGIREADYFDCLIRFGDLLEP